MLLSGSTAPPLKAALRFAVNFFFPELSYKLNLRTFDEDNLNFFIEIIKNSMNTRKERRNDFIDLLRDTVEELDDEKKKKINSENDITDYIIANGLMLFFVGNDTSSGALSLALHNMARYPDVQEKLYQEIQVQSRTLCTMFTVFPHIRHGYYFFIGSSTAGIIRNYKIPPT